jgi:hypothetical protein
VEKERRAADVKTGHATEAHSGSAPSACVYHSSAAAASDTINITEIVGVTASWLMASSGMLDMVTARA